MRIVFLVPWTKNHLSSFKCGFLNIFFAPKLAGLFVTPIVSATVEQIWREKCLKNHIPFDFWDDSTLAYQGAGKTIEKPLKELPWNQQVIALKMPKVRLWG